MTPDLIAQLEALGGMWTGAESRWGSYEIYTPLGTPEPILWCTPPALASLFRRVARSGLYAAAHVHLAREML